MPRRRLPTPQTALALAVAVLLCAAALRLAGLSTWPPGPHYDEAVNLLLARSMAFNGERPFPILEGYQGREVFYFYLVAGAVSLIHDGPWALRLTSAFCGLLTVAASLTAGRVAFGRRYGVWVGLAAGAALAFSLPHVLLSRQMFRAITLPMLQALALACLFVALRRTPRRAWPWLVAGGALAGLTLYTYMASRLFLVWLGLAALTLLAAPRAERALRLRQGALVLGVALAVAAPMLAYAVQRPDVFLGRLGEVTTGAPQQVTLAQSAWLHAQMFALQGDPYLRYNPPGRPYLTWPEGALLVGGWLLAGAWLLRRATEPVTRAAAALALLAPLMTLPSVISTGGLPPSHMRSAGMLPALVFALGLGAAWGLLRLPPRARAPLFLLGLALGTLWTARDYAAWATRADLFYEADADLALAAAWSAQHADGASVLVAARDYAHPTALALGVPAGTRWLGTEMLLLPAPGQTALALFPRSVPIPDAWLSTLERYAQTSSVPPGPDGDAAFRAYRLPADAPLPGTLAPSDPASAPTSAYLQLRAGAGRLVMYPAGRADVVTAWRVLAAPPHDDLAPVVQLVNADGAVLARAEANLRGSAAWQAGETLLLRVPLRLPEGTPPGDTTLRLAWVARSTGQVAPFGGGVWADVGVVHSLRPTRFPPAHTLDVPTRIDADVAPGVRLVGYAPLPASARPGERLWLWLGWQATPLEAAAARAAVQPQVVLVARDGGAHTIVADATPVAGALPSDAWYDGELVRDVVSVALPQGLPAGAYDVRLALPGSTVFVALGTLDVVGVARLFTPPPVDVRLDVPLGDALLLAGYTLAAPEDTARTLTLVWHAQAEPDTDDTVFVHVLGADGHILAQADAQPQQNRYPTTLWAAGEYVPDAITFAPWPAGAVALRVGLYDQVTGTRRLAPDGRDAVDIALQQP